MNTQIDLPYTPIITHDVDRYYKWKNTKSIAGEIGRIFRNQSTWSYSEAWNSFKNRKRVDPFSNLSMVAEMDKRMGLKSVFYIMTTEEIHPQNINDYNLQHSTIQAELKELISIGAEIGLHPGIYTYNDEKRMLNQKASLEEAIQQEVVRSRQHYLKYEYPETFKILESVGIQNDSSILVDLTLEEDREKRSTYIMLDEEGNTMNISQTPLVFMDTHHIQLKDDRILELLEERIAPAKKDGGEIMILWHNNNISNNREIGLYKEALEVIKK
ncbi:MAG: hypothetical protein P1U56_02135 [Saprospiraceae bacterium]|nr:hypothetical protein [Saprospiraceae bacterium]